MKSPHYQRFRQLDSQCPGRSEYGGTSGVEAVTGVFVQSAATGVGLTIGLAG
jgi:transketolase